MLEEIIKKFAYIDANDNQIYASVLWLKLLEILDPPALKTLTDRYQNKIPIQVMVDFTQAHFLRKQDQRWALANYDDFSPEKKAALTQLLDEYGQLEAQPFPLKSDFALFLGTSTANLAKRAFYIFDAIVKQNAVVNNVMILGTDEPYDQFMSSVVAIIESHADYFRDGITAADVPKQATMHEVMCFIFDNLRWPMGRKPNVIRLSQQRPCNTNKEIEAVSAFLSERVLTSNQEQSTFFKRTPEQCQLVVLSHQPFNDRQAIVALTGCLKTNILPQVNIQVSGAGMTTYPKLNTLPASTMSPAQLVDNLARALYELNQNAKSLLITHGVEEEKEVFEEYLDPNRGPFSSLAEMEFKDIYKSKSFTVEICTCLEEGFRNIKIFTPYGIFFRHDSFHWEKPGAPYVITHLNYKELHDSKMTSEYWVDPNALRLKDRLSTEDNCESKLREITEYFRKYFPLSHSALMETSPALVVLRTPADSENFLKNHLLEAGYKVIERGQKVQEENRSAFMPK